MTNYKYLRGASISDPSRVIFDIPDAPTIGTATDVGTGIPYNQGLANVTVTPNQTGGPALNYYVRSTPGNYTGYGASPVGVTGLQSNVAYTFSAQAVNTTGSSPFSSASTSSVTVTTVPQAPTIGTFTDGGTGTTGTLSFTAGSTGGKSITGYKVSTDGTTYTTVSGTTSPLSLTGLTVGTTTYYLKATNANGDSSASSGVSGTVIQPSNFYSIATYTVTSGGTSSVTFSSIPSGYTHLQLRYIAKNSSTDTSTKLFYNNDTSSTAYWHVLYGDGGSALTAGYSATGNLFGNVPSSTGITNSFGSGIVDLLDYSNPNKYKTLRSFGGYHNNGSAAAQVQSYSGLWEHTNAISTLTLSPGAGNFQEYSSFALYGVK